MAPTYTERTLEVKPKCTPGVLYTSIAVVHDVYMNPAKAKKVISRAKRPEYAPTFIRQWRDHRGKTQEQLAEIVGNYLKENGISVKGYTYASIGRIENGKMPYTQPILEAIAFALETTPASLLMRDPKSDDAIWSLWEKALPSTREIIKEQAEIVVKRQKAG